MLSSFRCVARTVLRTKKLPCIKASATTSLRIPLINAQPKRLFSVTPRHAFDDELEKFFEEKKPVQQSKFLIGADNYSNALEALEDKFENALSPTDFADLYSQYEAIRTTALGANDASQRTLGHFDYHLGVLSLRMNKHEEAVKLLESALAHYTGFTQSVSQSGVAASLASDVLLTLHYLSNAFLMAGNSKSSLAYSATSIDFFEMIYPPKDENLFQGYYTHGQRLFYFKEYKQALEWYLSAFEIATQIYDVSAFQLPIIQDLARAYDKLNDKENAIKYYEIYSSSKAEVEAMIRLLELAEETNRIDFAKEIVKKYMRMNVDAQETMVDAPRVLVIRFDNLLRKFAPATQSDAAAAGMRKMKEDVTAMALQSGNSSEDGETEVTPEMLELIDKSSAEAKQAIDIMMEHAAKVGELEPHMIDEARHLMETLIEETTLHSIMEPIYRDY